MKQKTKLNREQLLEKIERYTEVPMLVLVIVMIITLVLPIVLTLDPAVEHVLELVDWFIWGAFALELTVKTYLSGNRWQYLRTHWIDVLVVALPLLRIFRIFRVARLARGARLARSTRALRILRFARVLAVFVRFTTEVKTVFSSFGFNYLLLVFLGLIGLGTVLTYNFDQNVETGVNNLAESLWLTVVNAFSGGYANVYPETPEAKAVSIFLIVVGTVLVSYFTASLASYFTEKGQDIEQERVEQKIDALTKKIDLINKKLS
ncbi:ion transporter [Patescibacteria group bacterium]|nr:ion transporter [Patescibacteria group bacterium]MBU1473098.1 ion transporter [Patescibacteria group bacterium]MBU2459635.1 ion transporter [Patescibacteria group bacterium]MBU2544462.1 ion transporter [Patescibacteria group bacterium]